MKYLEFTFECTPCTEIVQDVLADVLASIGFDSFVHTDELDLPRVGSVDNFPEAPIFAEKATEDFFKAYIQEALYDADTLANTIEEFPLPDVKITYQKAAVEDKDWNAEWEKNYFQPIVIPSPSASEETALCAIYAPFHKEVPEARYRIVIDPRMSFGTGHHQTTAQMVGRILEDDMEGKEVLDMGCGTSILAMLAKMRGAKHCWAVDIDEWCVDNSRDNIALNHLDGIDVVLGTEPPENVAFDVVLANINRNILLDNMDTYVASMKVGGIIYMSGFYLEDVEKLQQKAETIGLELTDVRSIDNWACIKFVRKS